MNPDLLAQVWSLPGPQQFISKTVQSLRDGINLVVIYPQEVDGVGLESALLQGLHRDANFECLPIDLTSTVELEPIELLRSLFPQLIEYSFIEQAADAYFFPDVMILKGLECCSAALQMKWLKVLARWAEACRSTGSKQTIVLLIPAFIAASTELPPSDIRLAYRVWAGMPSALEVRLLCRMQSEEMNAESQWREYILASLAGNDISLCEHLWEEVYQPPEQIIEQLKGYAIRNHWTNGKEDGWMKSWRPKPPGVDLLLLPKDNGFYQISQRLSIYTPEYGEEIHPAILAMQNRSEEIIQRIWRAQAALVLPLIDDVRRRICNYMTVQRGPKWAVVDNEQLESPLELGKLRRFFNQLPGNSWEKRQWGAGITRSWNIRNTLAHYQVIDYSSFREFWQLSNSVHGMIYKLS